MNTHNPTLPFPESEFEHLLTTLPQKKDEAWYGLPWKPSILAACDEAAKVGKPVYMLVRSGHPLGCV